MTKNPADDTGLYQFDPTAYLPRNLFEAVTEVRVTNPEMVEVEAGLRLRRPRLTTDGRLLILATDHPGRRVTELRGDPMGMANRHDYLARALRILTHPLVDGIMGVTDFMEDLLILSHLMRKAGRPGLLDGKVLVGCMNRGGHAGVVGEIDDRFTCFSAARLANLRFEGGKMMYRLDLSDERSIRAIDDCAQAISALHLAGLYAFVEPMSVRLVDGRYQTDKSVEAMARDAGAAACLGESSTRTWLKLSYQEGYRTVADATCLPILMLGGPAGENPTDTIRDFAAGMRSAGNVRGAMVGRNVTFVHSEDPRAMAAAVGAVIHQGLDLEGAVRIMGEERNREMDHFHGCF